MQIDRNEPDPMDIEIEGRKRKKFDSDPRPENWKRSRRDSHRFSSNTPVAEPRPYNQMALIFDIFKNYTDINWTLKNVHEEKLKRAKNLESSKMELENTYYVWDASDEINDSGK